MASDGAADRQLGLVDVVERARETATSEPRRDDEAVQAREQSALSFADERRRSTMSRCFGGVRPTPLLGGGRDARADLRRRSSSRAKKVLLDRRRGRSIATRACRTCRRPRPGDQRGGVRGLRHRRRREATSGRGRRQAWAPATRMQPATTRAMARGREALHTSLSSKRPGS